MAERSGVVSPEREETTMKPKESSKLNETAKSAKPEQKDHHQSSFSELTCSFCNRQFSAKTGLISHR